MAKSMNWEDQEIMMLEEYFLKVEVQKLAQELWSLTMKGSDIATYTSKFSDLVVLSPGMVTQESKKVEHYI